MTALVTGSNGFVGSAVVAQLMAQGRRVRCLVRSGSDRTRLAAIEQHHPEAAQQIFVGSLASVPAARDALDGVDTVYHLAASLRGAAADMFLNTVVTSRNLLQAATSLPTPPKVVLVSSFSVYGVADLPKGHVVDEQTPLEAQPLKRDLYAQTKLRQEQLFWEYRERRDYPLVVLRPGVIYGPTGGGISARVGLQLPGLFLYLGSDNVLPLSYVDNCADAIVLAGTTEAAVGQIYNVHDDDLPAAGSFLKQYKKRVGPLRSVRVPYPLLRLGSHLVERYHHYSHGQLPAIFTPYKVDSTWKGNRFDNNKLKGLGWRQRISTDEGLERTFAYLRAQRRRAEDEA